MPEEANHSLRRQAEDVARCLTATFDAWVSPVAFVQTGSGFGLQGLLDEELGAAALSDLPHMPSARSAAGHELRLVLGRCGDNQVLVSAGRHHLYEGYGCGACVLPACGAALAGIRTVALLCAAGGLNSEYVAGTTMAVTDFINNLGTSPLVGPGPLGDAYFQEMNEAFSQELICDFVNTAAAVGLTPRLGVYQANLGPQYETPAEVEVARRNGADALGMSLVPVTIAATALGCRTLGLALITNQAASHGETPPAHQDVAEAGRLASPLIMCALNRWLAGELPT